MKRRYKLLIEAVGFFILLILGVSIIQDILILIFNNKITSFWLIIIRLFSALILIFIFLKATSWGKDLDNFSKGIAKKLSKKK